MLVKMNHSGALMIPKIFRVAMSGTLQIAELGQSKRGFIQRRALMLVHRQGPEGEILILSNTGVREPVHDPTGRLVAQSSVLGLRAASAVDARPHFQFMSALRPGFEPVGRFRPARGLAVVDTVDDRIKLQAWGMDEPSGDAGRAVSWSFDLSTIEWSGDMRFLDDKTF